MVTSRPRLDAVAAHAAIQLPKPSSQWPDLEAAAQDPEEIHSMVPPATSFAHKSQRPQGKTHPTSRIPLCRCASHGQMDMGNVSSVLGPALAAQQSLI